MKRIVRASIFWTFVAVFLIVAPTVVLYAFGFRYNFQTRHIERTGMVSFTTSPRDARVTIDGDEYKSITPTLVRQLLPHEHEVTLFKENFHTWKNTIKVESQKTLFLENVILWKNSTPEIQDTLGSVHLINTTADAIASIESGGAWMEVWIETLQKSGRVIAARFSGTDVDAVGMQWSPDGEYLLLSNGYEDIVVVKKNGEQVINVKDSIELGLDSIWWDNGQSHGLIAATKSRTVKLDIISGEITVLLNEPINTVMSADNKLYYTAQKQDYTHVIMSENGAEETIAIVPRGVYDFVSSKPPYLLLFEEARNRIVLLDANIHDEPILLNTEASEAFWSKDGASLLYTNGFETHIFNPASLEDTLITRVSEPITAIAWHPSGAAVVLTHPSGITVYDLHKYEGFFQVNLNNARDVSRVFVSNDGSLLYFLGTVDGEYGLYKQEIR